MKYIKENLKSLLFVLIGGLIGGIIEEVMLRLFLMSLIVFVISKVCKKENTKLYIIANIFSIIIFSRSYSFYNSYDNINSTIII